MANGFAVLPICSTPFRRHGSISSGPSSPSTLAFAGDGSGGLFSEELERAYASRSSSWEPGRLRERPVSPALRGRDCFQIRIGGRERGVGYQRTWCACLRTRRPTPGWCVIRRGILGELSPSAALRRELEQLYVGVCRVTWAVRERERWRATGIAVRRQLDILIRLRRGDHRSDGVGFRGRALRLVAARRSSGRAVPGERAVSSARRPASSYDANLATLSVNLAVGADGRIRGIRDRGRPRELATTPS